LKGCLPSTEMHGHELLKTIEALASDASSAAILRHAARFPIMDPARPELAEITAAGALAAEEMGRRIKGYDRVRIFHSPVKRCQQTSEYIARGADEIGLVVEHVGPESALGVEYIYDLGEAGRLSQLHGEHFVRLWVRGEVSAQVIGKTVDIAETKLTYLMGKLREPCREGRRLDLHISHDWNIMVLREHLLGVRHEEVGWLDFLDGISFSLQSDQLQVFYRQTARKQVLPWLFE
jgi:broad specificity phosphatase PhoE